MKVFAIVVQFFLLLLPLFGHAALNITLSAEFETNRYCDQWSSPGELCDPYAIAWWSDDGMFFWRMGETGHIPNTLNPVWTKIYNIPDEARTVRFEVWNYNYGQIDDTLGYNRVGVARLQNQSDSGYDWLGMDLIDPYGQGQYFGLLKVHILREE